MKNRKIFRTEANCAEFIFVNETAGTQHGFKHVTELYIGCRKVAEAVIHYYNRTWEKYDYQTSAKSAVLKAMEERAEIIKREYKERHNIKRLAGRALEECKRETEQDVGISAYRQVYKALQEGTF